MYEPSTNKQKSDGNNETKQNLGGKREEYTC